MKPISRKESHLRSRLAHPHDTWASKAKALRIAHRRWKRKRSKLLRRQSFPDA